jgi:uncharacterized protein YdeI (YjbR/CyaY-like superfamily)
MPVAPPSPADVHVFATAQEFRRWLQRNHASAEDLWVGYYKKGVGKTSMTYQQSVDEALCFGWIDGITRRIDDEVHANRFTPRRKGSSWSAINIAKMAELEAAGRMHPAGRRTFEERDRRRDAIYSYERPALDLAPELMEHLQADPVAWARWQAETPSFRRQAAFWIMSAKRPETQERRFGELLETSRAGRRPRPFVVERTGR